VNARKSKQPSRARFSYDGLNSVIHERARLSLLTSLANHAGGLSFSELKELCSLTDGNLNRHLLVLDEAKLVSVTKTFGGTRQVTRCKITALGRRRYIEYLAVLERIILDGEAVQKPGGVDGHAAAKA
jgi:DNA-binding transcriptional ArsR family regulator